MPWGWGCTVSIDGYGPWWLLVGEEGDQLSVRAPLWEQSKLKCSCLLSYFPSLIFYRYCSLTNKGFSSALASAYIVFFCPVRHPYVFWRMFCLFSVTYLIPCLATFCYLNDSQCNYTHPCPCGDHIAHILSKMLIHCVWYCHHSVTKCMHTIDSYTILFIYIWV